MYHRDKILEELKPNSEETQTTGLTPNKGPEKGYNGKFVVFQYFLKQANHNACKRDFLKLVLTPTGS